MRMTQCLSLAVFSLLVGVGCTRPKTVMEFKVAPVADPNSAKVVKIAKVTDQRKFMASTDHQGLPTTAISTEIAAPEITVRTIGQAHGRSDIVLPEGRTVEMVVREVVQNALREKGYSVVTDGASGGTDVPGVEVEVRKYWLWFCPGIWVVTVYFDGELSLKGPMVLNGSEEVIATHKEMSSPLAVPGMYSGTLEDGNNDLIIKLKLALKTP